MLAPRLLLIRHAQSEWNARGLWQGQGDPDLSADGLLQARGLVGELASHPIDLVIASDLRRAVQTAEPLAAARGLELELDPSWREHDVGAWSGLARSEIEARHPADLERFLAGDRQVRPGGGESREDLDQRLQQALERLAERHRQRRVALVTHLGVIFLLTGQRVENTGYCALPWPEDPKRGDAGAAKKDA